MRTHTNIAVSLCTIALFAAAALYQQLSPLKIKSQDLMVIFVMTAAYSALLSALITTILYTVRHKLYHPRQLQHARQWLFDGATSLIATAPASALGFILAEWLYTQGTSFGKLAPWTLFLSAGLVGSSAYLARVITKRAAIL